MDTLQTSSTLSWILTELLEKEEDFISIICKDGEVFKTSGLLLAAVSPLASGLLKSLDFKDCVLYLPDIDIIEIQSIFVRVYSFASNEEQPDSIDWCKDPLQQIFLFKSEMNNDDFEAFDDDNILNDDIDLFSSLERIKHENVDEIDAEDNKKLFVENCDSQSKISVKVEKLKTTRKRKLKGKNNVVKKRIKKKIKQEDDSDTENEMNVEVDPNVENVPLFLRKNRANGIIKYLAVKPEELPTDEKNVNSHEKLKNMLLDSNCDKEPQLFWCQTNGFNMKYDTAKSTDLKLICPLCLVTIPKIRNRDRLKSFFDHLQRHKLATYQCNCISNTEDKSEREKHIMIEHWKWVDCEHCHKPVDPANYKAHIKNMHKKSGSVSSITCDFCKRIFKSSDSLKYKKHIAYHKAASFPCDCQIVFNNKKQKVHHMQSVHLKELVCCSKCLFMTNSNYQLEYHDKKIHPLKKPPDYLKKYVCHLCGLSFNTASNIWSHKKRTHDTVLVNCPHCPKQYNALILKEHIKDSHRHQGVCNICGIQVNNLKTHMKNIHTAKELLKFPCPDCDKVFAFNQKLKNHQMNVHLKLRPYKCRYGCEFAYNDTGNRSAHERKKHGAVYSAKALNVIKDE